MREKEQARQKSNVEKARKIRKAKQQTADRVKHEKRKKEKWLTSRLCKGKQGRMSINVPKTSRQTAESTRGGPDSQSYVSQQAHYFFTGTLGRG